MSSAPALTQEVPRRPRLCRLGAKLTVLKVGGRWQVWYVSQVDERHVVWHWPLPGASTARAWRNEVEPFETWGEAMAHAATLRTYYGDQGRGDNFLFDLAAGRRRAGA